MPSFEPDCDGGSYAVLTCMSVTVPCCIVFYNICLVATGFIVLLLFYGAAAFYMHAVTTAAQLSSDHCSTLRENNTRLELHSLGPTFRLFAVRVATSTGGHLLSALSWLDALVKSSED